MNSRELFEQMERGRKHWFKGLFDQAEDLSMIITEMDCSTPRIIDISSGARKMFGYTKDEAIGLPITILHVEEDREMIPEIMRKMREGSIGFSGEHELVRKNGSTFFGLLSTYPIFDEDHVVKFSLGIIQDISMMKVVQKRISSENDKFRELLANLSEMVIEIDGEGRFSYVSPRTVEVLGYEPEEIIGSVCFDFVHPDDFELAAEKFIEVLKGEVVRDIEYRVKHKSGHYIDLSGSAKAIKVDDSTGFIASLRDITEKKKMEMLIQETGSSYKSIVQSSPMGMLFYQLDENEELIFMGANRTAQDILGFSTSDHLGKKICEVFPNLEGTDIPEKFTEAARDGIPWSWEQFHYQDENIFGTYEVHAYQTSQMSMAISFLEISDRINTQKQINESHATLNSIFRAAPVGIGMVKERVILKGNETLCNMLGYSQEEMIGREARFLYPTQEDYEYVGDEKYRQISEKGTGTVETRWIKKNGEIIDILMSSTPIDINDLSKGVTFTSLDITEMKKIREEAINEKNKASFYLDLMSHDIGNLHQGMASWAEIAQDKAFKPETRELAMKKIGLLQSRSTRLLKSILLLSRLKGMDLNMEETNVTDIINETIENLRDIFPEKSIDFRFESCCDEIILRTEPLVKEIFFNLFHNGVKVQNEDPVITVRVQNDDKNIIIDILDEGPGISDYQKKEIFQSYLEKPTGKRTGLGLSLVLELVNRYSGTISVHDRIQGDHTKGAHFRIELPKRIVGSC